MTAVAENFQHGDTITYVTRGQKEFLPRISMSPRNIAAIVVTSGVKIIVAVSAKRTLSRKISTIPLW